jgi:monofunctional biosynthetic peptidoglycan transglycosylase
MPFSFFGQQSSPIARPRRSRGLIGRLILRVFLLLGVGVAGLLLVIVTLRWLPVPTSAFMVIRQIERLQPGSEVPPIRYQWVDMDRISPVMALAVIAAEDQRFPDHWGFDFNAIGRAVEYNNHSERMRGASTISQQVAKNLFLWSGRSYLRKGLEAGLTLGLEALWSKERILEVYLNVAEFGDGIYGVHAASARFFGKTPDRLSPQDAALLGAVLPSPRRLHADRPSPYLLARARWISNHMGKLGGVGLLKRL